MDNLTIFTPNSGTLSIPLPPEELSLLQAIAEEEFGGSLADVIKQAIVRQKVLLNYEKEGCSLVVREKDGLESEFNS